MAVIPNWMTSPTYEWYEFYPIPDGVYTFTVRAIMFKPPLINDGDWPEISEDFHNLLVWGPASEVLPNVGKLEQAVQLAGEYKDGVKEFKGFQQVSPNRTRTFKDVHNWPKLPRRPLIENVDF